MLVGVTEMNKFFGISNEFVYAVTVTTNPQETTPLNPYKNYKDSIHPSLKKPFRIPFRSSAASLATVVTPQTKANTSSNHTGKESSHPLNKIIYQETQQSKLIHSHDADTAEIPQEPLKNIVRTSTYPHT